MKIIQNFFYTKKINFLPDVFFCSFKVSKIWRPENSALFEFKFCFVWTFENFLWFYLLNFLFDNTNKKFNQKHQQKIKKKEFKIGSTKFWIINLKNLSKLNYRSNYFGLIWTTKFDSSIRNFRHLWIWCFHESKIEFFFEKFPNVWL